MDELELREKLENNNREAIEMYLMQENKNQQLILSIQNSGIDVLKLDQKKKWLTRQKNKISQQRLVEIDSSRNKKRKGKLQQYKIGVGSRASSKKSDSQKMSDVDVKETIEKQQESIKLALKVEQQASRAADIILSRPKSSGEAEPEFNPPKIEANADALIANNILIDDIDQATLEQSVRSESKNEESKLMNSVLQRSATQKGKFFASNNKKKVFQRKKAVKKSNKFGVGPIDQSQLANSKLMASKLNPSMARNGDQSSLLLVNQMNQVQFGQAMLRTQFDSDQQAQDMLPGQVTSLALAKNIEVEEIKQNKLPSVIESRTEPISPISMDRPPAVLKSQKSQRSLEVNRKQPNQVHFQAQQKDTPQNELYYQINRQDTEKPQKESKKKLTLVNQKSQPKIMKIRSTSLPFVDLYAGLAEHQASLKSKKEESEARKREEEEKYTRRARSYFSQDKKSNKSSVKKFKLRSLSKEGDEFKNFRPTKFDFDDEKVTLMLMSKIQNQFCCHDDDGTKKQTASKLDILGKKNKVTPETMNRIEEKLYEKLSRYLSFNQMMLEFENDPEVNGLPQWRVLIDKIHHEICCQQESSPVYCSDHQFGGGHNFELNDEEQLQLWYDEISKQYVEHLTKNISYIQQRNKYLKEEIIRNQNNKLLIEERVRKFIGMNKTYAFIFYALEKDLQVKQIRHWRRMFYGIIQELEIEVIQTNKLQILRSIFKEESREETQKAFFQKHRTIRNNKENQEIFDDLYDEFYQVYNYFIYRMKNLVANNTKTEACKLIMQQYLEKYQMQEFQEMFEQSIEEMIYVRGKLIETTHDTIIKMLRQREPQENIQQYLNKNSKLHQLVSDWKIAFSSLPEKQKPNLVIKQIKEEIQDKIQKGVAKKLILNSYDDDPVLKCVPSWHDILNDHMDQIFFEQIKSRKRGLIENAIRREDYKSYIMSTILGGDPRVTEIKNWKVKFANLINEINQEAIYEDTFDMSQREIIIYCMSTRHFHKHDLIPILKTQENIIKIFEQGPFKSWKQNIHKLYDQISAEKLIKKHESKITKLVHARENKEKIMQEIKYCTSSCVLHDIDGWRQYLSEHLDQLLEQDEQYFEKPQKWQRINFVGSLQFDEISKDFSYAIDAECFYFKYKIVQYSYELIGSTHERFLNNLKQYQQKQWLFQEMKAISISGQKMYDMLINLTIERKLALIMEEEKKLTELQLNKKKKQQQPEPKQTRFIHIGNNYILNLDTMEQYFCRNGRIDTKYRAKASSEPMAEFDLLADNNGRRVESQFMFNEDFSNLIEKYFIFERDKAIFEMSSDLEDSDLLIDELSKSVSEQQTQQHFKCQSWLGRNWIQKNFGRAPTHRQVMEGFIVYARERLELDHEHAWNTIFGCLLYNLDHQVDIESHFENVDHKVLKAYTFIYSLSTYIKQALKRSTRLRDESVVSMLGPFAWILAKILEVSQQKRNRIQSKQNNQESQENIQINNSLSSIPASNLSILGQQSMCVWMVQFLFQDAISRFQRSVGEYIIFNTFTDTFLSRDKAIEDLEYKHAALSDPKAVGCLFKIYMDIQSDQNYFKFDSHDFCRFPDETMIVLQEGIRYQIIAMEDINEKQSSVLKKTIHMIGQF